MVRQWKSIFSEQRNIEKINYIQKNWKELKFVTLENIWDLNLPHSVLVFLSNKPSGKTTMALELVRECWEKNIHFIWGKLTPEHIKKSEIIFQNQINPDCFFEGDVIYQKTPSNQPIIKGFLKTLSNLSDGFGPKYDQVKKVIFDDITSSIYAHNWAVHVSVTNYVESIIAKKSGIKMYLFGKMHKNITLTLEELFWISKGESLSYYTNDLDAGFNLLYIFLDNLITLKKL